MFETAMTSASWFALLATFTVAVLMPGPDTFVVLRLGVRERRAAMFAACGIMIGNAVWTTASVVGLAALMRALPGAMPALQLIGSLVLIWLGVQSIRGGLSGFPRRATGDTTLTGRVTSHPLRLGLITNLSNPKALLFFTALFTQLLPVDATVFDKVMILIAFTVIGLSWFFAFAWFTSSQSFQRWFGRATPIIDIVAGIIFLLVAVVVLFELGVAWFA